MTQAAFTMSAPAESARPTPEADLQRAVAELGDKAREFARLAPAAKRDLLRECMPRIAAVAEKWVAAGCRAKGIAGEGPISGEEWLAGPVTTLRNTRLLAETLDAMVREGRPPLGHGSSTRADGRVEVEVFPTGGLDKALFAGFSCKILLEAGLDARTAHEKQASFYWKKNPEGRIALILGAGNVSSIPPMDALYKMFVDGCVCIVKMNPVNEWVGEFLIEAFKPLVDKGYLRIVYGGGAVGKYLTEHPAIEDIHITGSDKTHDLIVWGPPGEERERRKAANEPVLAANKTITSELGNVSPVVIVPGPFSDAELAFVARNVVTMVTNNASFNCNAAKMLVTAKGWPQRDKLLALIAQFLETVPPRKAYYPGARDRYEDLTRGRSNVKKLGAPGFDSLPWAIVSDVDAGDPKEKLLVTEPFCGMISHVEISTNEPAQFLRDATPFCNDRLWGTLNAMLVVHPTTEREQAVRNELDRAILDLRYGSVTINHWPGVVYGMVSPPWGGHPSATLANIQSGIGWVHNTYMIEGIEKSVMRGPLVVSPKPAWFFDNKKTHEIGRKMVAIEADPSWLKVPGLALTALGG